MKEIDKQKRALRTSLRARLHALDTAHVERESARVVAPLLAFLGDTRDIALFASRDHEISTFPLDDALRARGHRRLLPRIDGDDVAFHVLPADFAARDLPRDALGIPTPPAGFEAGAVQRAAGVATCVVVPGLAFDVRGARMGYGRGYYDRALRHADLERCVGLCLDEQLVDDVPMASHDLRLRWLCTPARGVFRTA